jgi:hypothetical protein
MMRVRTVPDQLFHLVTQLQVGPKDLPAIGTGFFVGYSSEDGRLTTDYLVSNRHVVRAGTKGRFDLHPAVHDPHGTYQGPDLNRIVQVEVPNWEAAWVDHPDPEVDVSVMNIGSAVQGLLRERRIVAYYTKLAPSMLAGDDMLQALDSLEEVLFVGFPEGIADPIYHLPVLRRGVTSTPPGIDYAGKPAFLVDGAVYAGASGCPVVLQRPGLQPVMGLPFGGQPILLGVLASTFEIVDYQRAERVDIPLRATGILRVKTYLNTGLAFKARCVIEAIDHHRKTVPVDEVV